MQPTSFDSSKSRGPSGSNFSGSDLRNITWDGRSFREANFSGADFRGANLADGLFIDCDFRHADLVDCCLAESVFYGCDFSHARFGATMIDHARFQDCRFAGPSALWLDWGAAKIESGVEYDDQGAVVAMTAPPVLVRAGKWEICRIGPRLLRRDFATDTCIAA